MKEGRGGKDLEGAEALGKLWAPREHRNPRPRNGQTLAAYLIKTPKNHRSNPGEIA